MPPAAKTDWERSEGNGDTIVTCMPFWAQLTAQLSPAIPLPITNTCFILCTA